MPDQIQDIKSAVDIIQLISEHVHLTKAGKNFRGLCPFHSEKTPSFFVTPDIQRFKCFGCGKAGDVFNFLQEYDSLTFAEALQQLAKRAGITLEKHIFSQEDVHRQRLYEVLSLTREYYHYVLTEHKLGQPARDYLKNRGITQETITTFKLGYALNAWDALCKYLIDKKSYTQREVEDVGLVVRNSATGNTYDRFRGRLMFPLTDAQGRVVGFSGRVLDPEIKEAKYINSPETFLYHKSELLFGYSTVKSFIRKEEEVIVVEGEIDALSSYQAGVKHVVAIKGSAFTDQHAKLLARTVKHVILALDADAAGVEATRRAIEIAKPYELNIRVLALIGGKDPDEIAKENPKLWREMAKKTISVFEFLLNAAFEGQDLKTGEGMRVATQQAVPVLASINNAVEQAHYIENAAERLGVRQDVLEVELRKYIAKQRLGGGLYTRHVPQPQKKKEMQAEQRVTKVERYLLSLLLHANQEFVEKALDDLGKEPFLDSALEKLRVHLTVYTKKHTFSLQPFSRSVPQELQQVLSDAYLEQEFERDQEIEDHLEKEWTQTLALYKQERLTLHLKQIADEMDLLEKKSEQTEEDQQNLEKLQKEFVRLSIAQKS
ncbi:MAG: DNA primase [Candidatus Pacebacteria bacterium]|nr:DNA primase [Candidatus Paceibacterota bacterium]